MALGEAPIFQPRKSVAFGGTTGGTAKTPRHDLGISAGAMCFEVAWSRNSGIVL
jgi:hypothetical protein